MVHQLPFRLDKIKMFTLIFCQKMNELQVALFNSNSISYQLPERYTRLSK